MKAKIKPIPTLVPEVPKTTGQLVKRMVKPYTWQFVLFFSLTFFGVLCWTASPAVIAKIINDLGNSRQITAAIWGLVLLFFVLRVIDEMLWRYAEYRMRAMKPQMVEGIRLSLFSAVLRHNYNFFVNASSGRVGHWVNRAADTMNELIDNTIWSVWGRGIGLIISAAFLFHSHWSLGVLFVVWLVLLFWYTIYRGRTFGKLVATESDERSKASSLIVDAISNHLSVRVFNSKDRERYDLLTQEDIVVKRWRDSWWQNWVTNIVKGNSAAIVSAIALIQVLYLYSRGMVQLGDILLFITYFGNASDSLWQLAWSFDAYYRQFGTIQNALDGLHGDNERELEPVKNMELPPKVNLTISNLQFAYPDQADSLVVKNLTVDIPTGQKVGLVGHSGAGKSTLVGLLLGFYEPTGGSIQVNGVELALHDPAYMRSISSYVPQDTNLFNRTIAENVAYARPSATTKEIEKALKQAQAYDFVSKLPDGVNTIIGERGVKLSGGQRQRIAIARALIQDVPLLLLDEATSALDSVSEQAIQKALHELMKGRTAIVVAHRLSTLKHLDKILVIDDGQCVEQGTHDQLLKQKGIYADLWARQKDGFIAE